MGLNIAPEGEVFDPNRLDIKNKIPSNGKSATIVDDSRLGISQPPPWKITIVI